MFMFGVLVYFLEEMGYPVAPIVIGLILGNMADVSLRRALLVSEGSLLPLVTRPIALILVLLIVFALVARTRFLQMLTAPISRALRRRTT
jgi:putative tricarboxylic transport membrane protein